MVTSFAVLSLLSAGVDPGLALDFHPKGWIVESARVRSIADEVGVDGQMAVWRLRKGGQLVDVTLYCSSDEAVVRTSAKTIFENVSSFSNGPRRAWRDADLLIRGGLAVQCSPRVPSASTTDIAEIKKRTLEFGLGWIKREQPASFESLPLVSFSTEQVTFSGGATARQREWYFHSEPKKQPGILTYENQLVASIYTFPTVAEATAGAETLGEPAKTDRTSYYLEQRGAKVLRLLYHFTDGRKAGTDPAASKVAEQFFSKA